MATTATTPILADDAAPDFGPNVLLFDPSTPAAEIKSKCDAIFAQEEKNEFGSERYAILFKQGNYKAKVNVGFYTQVCGLGKLPDDVTITGEVRCDAKWNGGNALVNFWRGCENLTVAPFPLDRDVWAVSQAAPLRRVHIKGSLVLFDGGWSSGGYLADSLVDKDTVPGSQQQWFSRNAEWASWNGGVWNMVFLGVTAPPTGIFPARPYTVIAKTPVIAEKPFLYIDPAGVYSVFVPSLRKESVGISWKNGQAQGSSIPLTQFYIARADKDTAATLNAALGHGLNLLLTPGIYNLDDTLRVTRADTIVLGLGMATLSPRTGKPAMEVADVDGVRIASVLFDAGPVESPYLLQIGEPGSTLSHAEHPTVLSDVFARVGGATVGVAKSAMIINSNDVIGDHAWLWRADHGAGAGWDKNKSANGLIVNGSDVTYYGLFVEHFQEAQTLWNGENGRVYFYQCEMPYDSPTQDDWKRENMKGWPGYKVSASVKNHEAWGVGVYCVFTHAGIYSDNAVEAPNVPGVKFHDVLAVRLGGASDDSGINNVINGKGGAASKAKSTASLAEYPLPLDAQ